MKEKDIRPQELHEKYMDLSRQDAKEMDRSAFVHVECPACASDASGFKFTKNDFKYVQCIDCGSLYCSPRPGPETLNRFYEESESSHYWASVFFPAVAEARREKLFRQKAKRIQEIVPLENKKGISICDIGAGYGVFLEELGKVFPLAELYAIEPSPELAKICKAKGFTTMISSAEDALDWHDRFDLVISSEVIEHVFSPEEFVRSLHQLTKPSGQVLLTGLGYEGFDLGSVRTMRLDKEVDSKGNPCASPRHVLQALREGRGDAGIITTGLWNRVKDQPSTKGSLKQRKKRPKTPS